MISNSALIERLKINGALARRAIHHLEKEGKIKRIVHHSSQLIYSAYIHNSLALTYVLTSCSFLARNTTGAAATE